MSISCVIVKLLSVLPGLVTEEIRAFLLEVERRDRRFCNGYNLLSVSCLSNELQLPSIRFLVQLGANTNARTNDVYCLGNGCRVLYFLAKQPESETRDAEARLLLDLGAHLDMADKLGLKGR